MVFGRWPLPAALPRPSIFFWAGHNRPRASTQPLILLQEPPPPAAGRSLLAGGPGARDALSPGSLKVAEGPGSRLEEETSPGPLWDWLVQLLPQQFRGEKPGNFPWPRHFRIFSFAVSVFS